MVGLLLLVWALRLPPLLRTPLHPDEALYGTWGLSIGEGRDPWLSRQPMDKPPLLPYAIAGSQLLFGHRTIAPRLPGLAAGVLMVPLTGALAGALYRQRSTGTVAALGVALSPFAIVFSGTAFPDPTMVALGTAACLAAARRRPAWAGLLAGLSFAAKQTGLVWLPLSLLLLLILHRNAPDAQRPPLLSCLGVFALVVGLVFAWDLVRVLQGARSFWGAGVVGYGGLRLIWPQELWPRLLGWLRLVRYLFASPLVNALLLVGVPALLFVGAVQRPGSPYAPVDLLLVVFLLLYVLFHWLVAFPIWDRYLLPLVPVLAVVLGRIVQRAASRVRALAPCRPFLVAALLLALLTVPAVDASAGRSPIGHESGVYQGIDDVIAFLARRPEGSVVYHHWLGWHYHYGLWDAPVYLAYWPHPAWLARDVQAFGGREPRFITFPAWESSARVERALADVGYRLAPVLTVPGPDHGADGDGPPAFTVYQLVPVSN